MTVKNLMTVVLNCHRLEELKVLSKLSSETMFKQLSDEDASFMVSKLCQTLKTLCFNTTDLSNATFEASATMRKKKQESACNNIIYVPENHQVQELGNSSALRNWKTISYTLCGNIEKPSQPNPLGYHSRLPNRQWALYSAFYRRKTNVTAPERVRLYRMLEGLQ